MRMERWTLDRSFKGLCDSDVGGQPLPAAGHTAPARTLVRVVCARALFCVVSAIN
jgi:hypothetical protein